jgi:hippurate hydrolase
VSKRGKDLDVIEAIRQREHALTAIRRDLHANPELAYQEARTSELVARHLEAQGIETHRGIGGTGVVGILKAGSGGQSIALRADMDALPITERNDFAHLSSHPGQMHACGHDGHTTMLLGAAEYLAQHRDFDGTVVLIFQPAEEGEGGSRAMLDDGLLERFPFDRIFGMHNWPGLAAGTFAVMPGPVMASSDYWQVQLFGRGAHAAMPHLGLDPVTAGASLVQALQTVITRSRNPLDPAVLSVTQFHAGEAYNVIPDRATLIGTVRALSNAMRDEIETGMDRVIAGVAQAHGLRAEFDYRRGYPPTINSTGEAQLCALAASRVVGSDAVLSGCKPSMAAEDFSFFAELKPACYVWIGNGPAEGGRSLHSSTYDFNDGILTLGASYWVRLVEAALPVA